MFRIILLMVWAIGLPVLGQEIEQQGTIAGTVVNAATQEPLAGVNILIVGTSRGTSTDEQGKFLIPDAPIGTYAVRAASLGYQTEVKTDVVVNVVRQTRLSFSLRESPFQYEEVIISGEYFIQAPDLPVSTRTQSTEEIRRLPGGFEDVVRAISILPGVAQAEPGRNDLIVRGGAPSENLFIVDNITVPTVNHFGTQGVGGGPISFLNLDNMKETTFSTGGFGARYGDKLSSVLKIDMRDGREDRIGGKVSISATQFGAQTEGPLSENGSFLFSARRSYLDFIFKAAGFAFVPEYWDFFGKVTQQLSSSDDISILAIGALDNVRLFNDTPKKRYDNSRILVSNQNQFIGGVTWRHLFPSGYASVTAGQSYITYDTNQRDTLLQPLFSNRSLEHESSLHADVILQLSGSDELSAGIQLRHIRFFSFLMLAPFWTNYGQQLSVKADTDTTTWKIGGYGQLSKRFGSLEVTVGGRFDYFPMIASPAVVAPRAGTTLALSSLTSIKISLGQYYQSPSYIWLVSHPMNSQLRFMKADQIVIGMDHLLASDTRISLEGYIKRYSKYPVSLRQPFLVLSNTGAGFGGTAEAFASFGIEPLTSEGVGSARGVEFFFQKRLSDLPWYGTFSLAYNETRFTALDGVSRPGSFDQRWILNLGGGVLPSSAWEISTKFRFATGRPFTPYTPDGTQSATLYNSQRVDHNHSLDLRIERRWSFDTWVLHTYIDVQNVYNRKPRTIPRFNERIGQVEQPDAIGVLPSIGVAAEF